MRKLKIIFLETTICKLMVDGKCKYITLTKLRKSNLTSPMKTKKVSKNISIPIRYKFITYSSCVQISIISALDSFAPLR